MVLLFAIVVVDDGALGLLVNLFVIYCETCDVCDIYVTFVDEDMTPMHMTMFGAWYGGLGGRQGCPSQEGGPWLIRFESPR